MPAEDQPPELIPTITVEPAFENVDVTQLAAVLLWQIFSINDMGSVVVYI